MTTVAIPETDLPEELDLLTAVAAAYPAELARVVEALGRGLPVLVECEKDLAPLLYRCLGERLRGAARRLLYVDGADAAPGTSRLAAMIAELRVAVHAGEDQLVVLPHLDLLTAGDDAALSAEGREVVPLLFENPRVLWLGFRDPSFPAPRILEGLFPRRETFAGVARDRLRHLVTRRESRKLGRGLNPYLLHKHVSGLNAVRLRRLLGSLAGEDYPASPAHALAQLRTGTLAGAATVPDLDLRRDVGGYAAVKERLEREILDVLARKDALDDAELIARVEALVPRGLIFWGPPGTGKTLFARAMASALGAAITVVSGPELKSARPGEAEERLRQVFVQARRTAPSVIVFDELDSFAAARGASPAGLEHSLVNGLLTEMDGFRKNELVFVVGTTNFLDVLDPALLRPGRFELHIHVPYPERDDRREILLLAARRLGLDLEARALDYAATRTGDPHPGGRFSGDHLQALCRGLARDRLRGEAAVGPAEIEAAIERLVQAPALPAAALRVLATHEAGHALAALVLAGAPAPARLSLRGDLGAGLALPEDEAPHGRAELRARLAALLAGREAEELLLEETSTAGAADLARAARLAAVLVEQLGLEAEDDLGPRRLDGPLSETARGRVERLIADVLETERTRARRVLAERRRELIALRDLLLERRGLDAVELAAAAGIAPAPR